MAINGLWNRLEHCRVALEEIAAMEPDEPEYPEYEDWGGDTEAAELWGLRAGAHEASSAAHTALHVLDAPDGCECVHCRERE